MEGNILDIDSISGSDDDREGGIIVVLKDNSIIEASVIVFDMESLTFETS